jgi:hypothetical protein
MRFFTAWRCSTWNCYRKAIGLHLAGNPATPYGGNRDMVITIGSGSGEAFRPWLRLATGSAILAEQVAKGDGIELAFRHLEQ